MVFSAFNVTPHMQGPVHEKTFDVPHGICYNNQAHPAGLLRPAGNIWSITQEVEEVALESLQPAGRFVRREWRDGGIFPRYASDFYPLILHRNLAFFRKVCKAVLEKLNMEMYSRGRKREHSKGRDPLAGLSAVNPTTAGFAGPCTPPENRCSCTEISHSSE